MNGEDYTSAAYRHWDGCTILGQNHQWQEAAYLAGYVAECAMKAALEHAFSQSRSDIRRFGHNLARLQREGLSLAVALNPAMRRYWPDPLPPHIRRWNPAHRYARTGFLPEGDFQQMVQEANAMASQILLGMALDGYISFPAP